jgi:hypothetical protein
VDPRRLFDVMSRSMRIRGFGNSHAGPIIYSARRGVLNDAHGLHPIWSKHPQFKEEQEIRFVWSSATRVIAPVPIRDSELIECIRAEHMPTG